MSEYSDIQVEIEDPVALIRLNRPDKLNAVTSRTLRELRSAIDAAAADSRVVGIVITGNGRGFCSGLDAEQLVRTTSEPVARRRGPSTGVGPRPGKAPQPPRRTRTSSRGCSATCCRSRSRSSPL